MPEEPKNQLSKGQSIASQFFVTKSESNPKDPKPNESATGSFSMEIDPAMGNSFSIMSTKINDRIYSDKLLAKMVEDDVRKLDRQRAREHEELCRVQDRYPKRGRTCLLVGGSGDGRTYFFREGSSMSFAAPGGIAERYVVLIEDGPLVIMHCDRLSRTDALMLLMQGYDGISRRR